jgi:hypothetical protein
MDAPGLKFKPIASRHAESYGCRREHGAKSRLKATVVLFGGWQDGVHVFGDTWVWDGRDWTEATPATSPPARTTGSMATVGDKIVMWGGVDPNGHSLTDTWLWDGADWMQVITPTSPPASLVGGQSTAGLAERVVLLGSWASRFPVKQTWTFDGSSWSLSTANDSPVLVGFGIATAGDRVLVAGGGIVSSEEPPNIDTYAWDGTVWTDLGASPDLAGDDPMGTLMASFTP